MFVFYRQHSSCFFFAYCCCCLSVAGGSNPSPVITPAPVAPSTTPAPIDASTTPAPSPAGSATTVAPAPASPTATTPGPTPADFLGCYKDKKDDRVLSAKIASKPKMSASVRETKRCKRCASYFIVGEQCVMSYEVLRSTCYRETIISKYIFYGLLLRRETEDAVMLRFQAVNRCCMYVYQVPRIFGSFSKEAFFEIDATKQ